MYARWRDNTQPAPTQFTITFNTGEGGSTIPPVTADANTVVGKPANPTRDGYAFAGWYSSAAGTTAYPWPYTLAATVTMYAHWETQYTVTFDADGGNPATQIQTWTASGGWTDKPSDPDRSGYSFGGWYTERNGGGSLFTDSMPESNVTVYALWTAVTAALVNLSPAESLAWISANATEGGEYTFALNGDGTITPYELSYGGKAVSITILGSAMERTISLEVDGSLFTVGNGVTLTLGINVTLRATSRNTDSLVRVNTGGTLVMKDGSKISGNSSDGVYIDGGAFTMNGGTVSEGRVNVANAGVFTMSGGTVSEGRVNVANAGVFTMSGGTAGGVNVASNGAFTLSGGTVSCGRGIGVNVASDGVFTMSGGTVSNNHNSWNALTGANITGGGVYVENGGVFTMNDGIISDNSAGGAGGGVYVGGTFTMSGGTINDNSASTGGGVYVGGTFTMSGGTISGNTAFIASDSTSTTASGGGVYVENGGVFTMNDGIISGNSASASATYSRSNISTYGGGVYVRGTFTMNDGTISGNSARASASGNASYHTSTYGGGVYASGTFTMNDGTISGNSARASVTSASTSYSYYSSAYGGGVYVTGKDTFTMSGGTINDNFARASFEHDSFAAAIGAAAYLEASGGGVCAYGDNISVFTMNGGTISGNSARTSRFSNPDTSVTTPGAAASYGDGVYAGKGTFTKSGGGTIYGSDADNALKNSPNAVYVGSSPAKKRTTTAGPGVNLDSTKDGAAGGWEE
jgi:uncharacterized repeat protein (TIGR02543 family)